MVKEVVTVIFLYENMHCTNPTGLPLLHCLISLVWIVHICHSSAIGCRGERGSQKDDVGYWRGGGYGDKMIIQCGCYNIFL